MTLGRTTSGESPVIDRDTAFTWPVVVAFVLAALTAGGVALQGRATAAEVADLKGDAKLEAQKKLADAEWRGRIEETVKSTAEDVKSIHRKLDRALGVRVAREDR